MVEPENIGRQGISLRRLHKNNESLNKGNFVEFQAEDNRLISQLFNQQGQRFNVYYSWYSRTVVGYISSGEIMTDY